MNSDHPETIYLVTYWDRGLSISGDRGDTWGARKAIPGGTPVTIIVDPRYASDLANVHLIVATSAGVYYSANSGVSWTQVAAGDAFSLALRPGHRHGALPCRTEESEPPENRDRIERESEGLKYMPSWARDISRDRERERGK